MNEIQVIQALLYLDDGTEVLVEPKHMPRCLKQRITNGWSSACEGCKFDLLAKEILELHRPVVTDVNHKEDATSEQA